jgi:hypothetical protein
MKKILIGLLILFLIGCNRDNASQQTTEPSKSAKAADKITNPVLTCKPEDLRAAFQKAYRLTPDRRFVIAISEIRKFFPSRKEETVQTEFANGNWRISYGGEEIGTLPEFPDFPDFMNVLTTWAKRLNDKDPIKLTSTKEGESLELKSRELSLTPQPIQMLMKADELWAKQKDPALLAAAARASTYMAVQAYRPIDIGDFLDGRSLALITLTKALTSYPMNREESLLAYTMLYTKHSESAAALLPPSDPVRMFIQKADLNEKASAKEASEEIRYLRMIQLSKQPYTQVWLDGQSKLFPHEMSLPVIKTALELRRYVQTENQTLEYLANDIPPAVISELQTLQKGSPSKPEIGESDQKLLRTFETLIDELYKKNNGIFANAELLASFYNSFFYSSYSKRNQSPGKGKREISMEFDRYISLFDSVKNGNPKVENFIQQVRSLKLLNSTGAYALYALISRLSWNSPSILLLCRESASTYDSRPFHRINMLYLYKWKLYDRNHAEQLSTSMIKTFSSAHDAVYVSDPAVYLGDIGLVKQILHSAQCDEKCASDILWNWHYIDSFHNQEIEGEYDRQIQKNPHSWQITNVYIDFLRRNKKYSKACTVTQAWLKNNADPNHVGSFHAYVRLAHNYYLAGEYQKSLDALKPVTPSWVADRESALALSKLGQKEEAEKRARSAFQAASQDLEGLLALVQVLWEARKYKDAASTLQSFNYPYQNWCSDVGSSFYRAFEKASVAEVHQAIDALRAEHLIDWRLTCLPLDFVKAHQYEMAFEIQSYIMPPGSADENITIDSYTYLKEWKGEKEAIQWVKKMIPPQKLNSLGFKALYKGEYNLLWDVIEDPYFKDYPHFVWLFRAASSAKRGMKQDSHYQEVYNHFAKAGRDGYYIMGRYLIGLSPESEMLNVAKNPKRRGDVCYYLGLKAESEGRIKDASEWYRIAVETEQAQTHGAILSQATISGWPLLGFWSIDQSKQETKIAEKN